MISDLDVLHLGALVWFGVTLGVFHADRCFLPDGFEADQ